MIIFAVALASFLYSFLYTTLREDAGFVPIWIFAFLIFFLATLNLKTLTTAAGKAALIYVLLFFIRIVILIYQSLHGNIPMSGTDWPVFFANAENLITGADNLIDILFPKDAELQRTDLYDRINAIIFYIFDYSTSYMYHFSYLMSEITFYLIYRTNRLIANPKISSYASILFYIWPMEIIFSVAYLREMTIQCAFALSLYLFLSYIILRKKVSLIGAIFMAYICALIHSGMIAVLVSYVTVLAIYNPDKKILKITPAKLIFTFGIFALALLSGSLSSATERFNSIDNTNDVLRRVGSITANTDYISAPSSSIGILLQTPLRLFYFILSPLPWQVYSFGTLIAFALDGTLRLIVVYQIYNLISSSKKLPHTTRTLIKIFALIWISTHLLFSWGTNNFGTAMRHRLKIFPVEIILLYTLCKNRNMIRTNEKD